MKFNKHISTELPELLTTEWQEYKKITPMTKKERRAVRKWVKERYSVYENRSGAFCDGQVPVEFLIEWRENEYIRKHTKGMTPEETKRFAFSYYGWDTDEILPPQDDDDDQVLSFGTTNLEEEDLPFS